MKVLLADDDRVTASLLSTTLARRGWEVTTAHDAMQALMYASKRVPDAIVLDINMPGGTGYHTLERIRSSSKTQHIPVVIITGSTDLAAELRAKRIGANGFLKKPVDPRELGDLIASLTTAEPTVPDDEPVPEHSLAVVGA